MSDIFNGLGPVFAVIMLGYVIRRLAIVPDAFWPAAEHLTFYFFFPALLFVSTATAGLAGPHLTAMAAAVIGGILAVVALVAALRLRMRLDGPTYTSAVQSAVRPNVYVAIATATGLYGAEGLALMTLCIALSVPLVNLISVIVLVRYAAPAGRSTGVVPVVISVFRNPLIAACVLGVAVNASGWALPTALESWLHILGRASLAIGLLAVGAGLDPGAAIRSGTVVTVASVLKLLVLPLAIGMIGWALGVGGVALAILVLFGGLPVSASAYVMARQMGGNAPAMAAAITVTTVASALTMPALLALVP
jgi:hypothetical protein